MLLILTVIFSLATSTQAYYNYTSTVLSSWQTLNETKCLNRGVILSGLIEITNTSLTNPIGCKCPNETIVLEPGVFLTANNSITMVSSNGSCLISGVVDLGRLVSIGPLTNESNQTCGVSLNPGTVVYVLPASNHSSTIEIRDNPLVSYYRYMVVTLNETMCIESAIVLNAVIDANYNGTNTVNGKCPNSSALVEPGIIAEPSSLLPDHFCLINAFVKTGRVIATGPLVSLGMNLTSGAVCSLNGSLPTGVVLKAGITLLIPKKGPEYSYSKVGYYNEEPFHPNPFSKLVMDYLKAVSIVERSKNIKQEYYPPHPNPPYYPANNHQYRNKQPYPNKPSPNRPSYPNRQQQNRRPMPPLIPPNNHNHNKYYGDNMMPRYLESNILYPYQDNTYSDSNYQRKKYGDGKKSEQRPSKTMQMYINQGIGSLHIGHIEADLNIDVDFD